MSTIQFGCQTYTWQMSYEKYRDELSHIIEVVGASDSYRGIEPEVCMLGSYRGSASRLADDLAARDLSLAALTLVLDWHGTEETDEERAEADWAIGYVRSFPGALLALCQMPGDDRSDLAERQRNCIRACNAIAQRAAVAGVETAFHPNSPEGSVFRTAPDYEVLLDGMDGSVLHFAPDAGHIARGGMDPVEIFEKYRSAIRHVHFKDMDDDQQWAMMGKGRIDFDAIVRGLEADGYDGWIMVEDESPTAEDDPDLVSTRNAEYIKRWK